MNIKKIAAALLACALVNIGVPMQKIANAVSAKENKTVAVEPVFEKFDNNLVNGEVSIELPEGITADASIVFYSPDWSEEQYYQANLKGGSIYTFAIEGFDNTEDDYRRYKLTLCPRSADGIKAAASYTEEITVPDVNDNPDSFKEFKYIVKVSDKEFDGTPFWVSDSDNGRELTFAFQSYILGDVDNDGIITAYDASLALTEYTNLSGGNAPTFDSRAEQSADVDEDGMVTAYDASLILTFYTYLSGNGTILDMREWIKTL